MPKAKTPTLIPAPWCGKTPKNRVWWWRVAITSRAIDSATAASFGGLHIDAKGNQNIRVISSPVATPEFLVAGNWRGDGPLFAIKPGAKGLIQHDGPFVQWHLPKAAPDVPTPLIRDGLVYLAKAEFGQLTCVDLATGKEVYKERLHGGKYRASPVYADGKIYVTSHDGYVSVIKAGRKFEMLADNKLDDNFSASPAIANGRIYMRGWGQEPHLYAIETSKK